MISSRPKPKVFSGFYEFPGGKLKKGEFSLEGLKREMNEELSIEIDLSKIFFLMSYSIKRRKEKILLTFFLCNQWKGIESGLENQKIKWVKIEELKKFKILKSNERVIAFLSENINYFSSK